MNMNLNFISISKTTSKMKKNQLFKHALSNKSIDYFNNFMILKKRTFCQILTHPISD